MDERKQEIVDFIRKHLTKRGYPPSLREIGEAVGLSSPSSVKHQLDALERAGVLRRDPRRPRALEVVEDALPTSTASAPAPIAFLGHETAEGAVVPLVGRIAAGGPILAEQMIEDTFTLPRQLVGQAELFMLRVSGDSMIDAAICDGDWVV
ncbi:MAG: transcriptional repressor LexA, partial [Ruaniaceae bacterium]|nr:transcriptional repressor LexA [Ruaniaceae bacterium]